MPKLNTHLHLAIKLSNKINIKDLNAFYLGNAYPDCWNVSIDQSIKNHYKKQINDLCDLESFKTNEEMNDFNLGYYFHLWIDNRILEVDTGDISKYDCMICDMQVIIPIIEQLKQFNYIDKELQSMNNILSLEKEPMPLYLVSNDKKNRYEEILDSLVNEFIEEYSENTRVINSINDNEVVTEQYKDANKLNTRISIHTKYSINKMGFGNWIISNYDLKDNVRILELGCGTGDMWKKQIHLLDNVSELVLTDFSSGMLQTAKDTLAEYKHISYNVVDIQDIPYEDNSFDIVIANMMLYHVPDIHKGLSEVRRVLKSDGAFYCATYGENGIVEYISSLLKSYKVEGKLNKNFTLQNGNGHIFVVDYLF